MNLVKNCSSFHNNSSQPNHLAILEGVLTQAETKFGKRELIAIVYVHITEHCQNRRERRQAYRIAAKILKCDRQWLQKVCERLSALESHFAIGGVGL